MADFNQSLLQLSGGRELLTVTKTEQLLSEWTNLDPVAIRLSNKSFDQESAFKVAEYLDKISSTLQIADISDVIAGRPEEEALKAIKVLATGLKRFELIEINVSDNAFGAKGIEVCREILTGKRMEKLYVCNNGLSAEACLLLSEILLDGSCPPLKLFHFYNNMSGDGGGKALSVLIKACVELEDLRFSATRCGNSGCLEIAKAVGALNKLRKLDLSDNTFGIQAAKILAESLKVQTNLEVLNLRDDGFTTDGVEAIFTILESTSFPHLTTLDLSGNEITEDTMEVLTDWLASAVPNLTHLYLDDNELGSDGVLLLSRVISKLTNLTFLSLNTCEITAKGAFSITKAVSKLKKFHKLDLNGNMISSNGVEEIQAVMMRAKKLLGDLDDNDEDGDDDLGDLSDSGEEDGEENDKEEEDALVDALKAATI